MANTHSTLTGLFTDIADAIRVKTGGTESIVADQFPEAISNIKTGTSINGAITETNVASGYTINEGDFVKSVANVSEAGYSVQTYTSTYGNYNSHIFWLKDNYYLICYHSLATLIQVVDGKPVKKATCNMSSGDGALMYCELLTINNAKTELYFFVKGNYSGYNGRFVKLVVNYSSGTITHTEIGNYTGSSKNSVSLIKHIDELGGNVVIFTSGSSDDNRYFQIDYYADNSTNLYSSGYKTEGGITMPSSIDRRQYSVQFIDFYKNPNVTNGYKADYLVYVSSTMSSEKTFAFYTFDVTVDANKKFTAGTHTLVKSNKLESFMGYGRYIYPMDNQKAIMVLMSHSNSGTWPVYLLDSKNGTISFDKNMPLITSTSNPYLNKVINTYNNDLILTINPDATNKLAFIKPTFDGNTVNFQHVATVDSTTAYNAGLRGQAGFGEYGYLIPFTDADTTNYTDFRILNPGVIPAISGESPTGVALQSGTGGDMIQIAIP